MNYINLSLENLSGTRYTHLNEITFGMLILQAVRFLLCVINIYSKYAWAVPSNDKRYYNYQCISENQTGYG